MSLSCTISEIKKLLAKFSYPVYLMPPLRGFPLEFFNGAGAEKNLEQCPYQIVEKV